MTVRWLDDAARRRLAEAVTAIEAASAVEVRVAVRRASRAWPHVPLTVGALTAWAALAFMLYADHAFATLSFLLDPVVAGVLGGLASTVAPQLVRWLTPRAIRRRAVLADARATFVELGVHHTRGRTGVLIYCALAERMVALVVDGAIATAIPAETLAAREATIARALPAGGPATAAAIADLAALLGAALPRAADDVNELPDAVDHDLARRPRS
jgi:putative membrane protein